MRLRFRDWPLRIKTAALLTLASLVPLVVAAVIDVRQARERIVLGTADLLGARADQLTAQLDTFHRGYERSVNRVARFPEIKKFCRLGLKPGTAHETGARAILDVYPESDPGIWRAAILDSSGTVKVATNKELVGRHLAYLADVRQALKGNVVVSDIQIAESPSGDVPVIAYLAPVSSGGRLSGVAMMWVRAETLWKIMRNANGLAGAGSFAVLFDSNGVRIAHTYSQEIVFHPGGPLSPAVVNDLVAERRFGEKTRELLGDARSFPEQFDRALSKTPDTGLFRGFAPVNRKWTYGVGRRFETVPWTIFYMIPEGSIDSLVGQMTREKALFAGSIILIALTVGTFCTASILNPIRKLSKAIESIGDGDFSARIPPNGRDEIGLLGASFNAMTDRIEAQAGALRQARDELEVRVEERTADLRQTSERLEKEIAERTQAEKAIRASQNLLRDIVDNSAAVIYVKDLEGRYSLVNRRYSEIFHISQEDIVGKTDYDLFSKEAADAFRMVDERVAAAQSAITQEEMAPHDDGMHTYISVKCPLWDTEGKPYAIFGISTDISDRKQMEGALRSSEEHTRLIVETAMDASITIDRDGVISAWSPQAESTFGWPRAQIVGQRLDDTIIPENYREAHRAGMSRYLATGEAVVLNQRLELTALHRDGHEFPIELSITPILVDGSVTFSAFVRDITERKHAEYKLGEQLARLKLLDEITRGIGERQDLHSIFQVVIRTLEDQLPLDFCCVCLYDQADDMLIVNGVGVKSEALAVDLAMTEESRVPIDQNGLSRCVRGELVYESDITQVPFPFPRRLAGAGLKSLVVAPLLAESQVFGVLVSARQSANSFSSADCEFLRQLSEHVALAAGQAQLHATVQQAYDDLRHTQQSAMQHERLRALGQMASGIAHDINNAISPVVLYTESLLQNEPNLSQRARSYLETIARSIDDVAATVARMREFYRQREPQLVLARVSLNRLVQEVIDLTKAAWSDMPQQRGIVIEMKTDLTQDLPDVMVVESEIREVLTNLVFNAVDAMPEGGTLTLRSRVPERPSSPVDPPVQVFLEVVDDGVGMDEETKKKCLEPFYTTKGERGTGLGLAMVYGVIQRHSAEIEIESVPGKGSTFRLIFLAPAGVDTAEAQLPGSIELPSSLRILIVDDDPLLLRSLHDTLTTEGHTVVTANGGQAGIDACRDAVLRGKPFPVVITDLGMPNVDGRKVADAVKDVSPSTFVVMLTGWGQRMVSDGDIPPHVDWVLSKPPKLADLRKAFLQSLRASKGELDQ